MIQSVKVSTKHQIVVPSAARRALGIEPGDRLDVRVTDDEIVLRKRPARASERLWGLGRGLYGPDPVTFVRAIRDELEEELREREDLVARGADPRSSSDRS
jgi:AbrB family looped-hinge helix DNA binding protein